MKTSWDQTLWAIENLYDGDVDTFLNNEKDDWLIDNYYGGDKERFKAAQKKSTAKALEWHTIQNYTEYMPEYQEAADAIIQFRLGYFLEESLLMTYSPAMRDLIVSFVKGGLSLEQFQVAADLFIQQIRNADCKTGGWVRRMVFDKNDYQYYHTFQAELREKARRLVSEFLGYEPDLNHSLNVELSIRAYLHKADEETLRRDRAIRIKIITLVKYRETYVTKGEAAADALPLYGHPWLEYDLNRMLA